MARVTSGARSLLSGVRSLLSGVRSLLSGVRSLLSGARSLLPGVRSLLPGVRSLLPGGPGGTGGHGGVGGGRGGTARPAWVSWAGLVAVPLVVAGMLAWAFGNGLVHQGSAVAAVVNDDEPVTINGRLIPLGRQLAGKLVDGTDSRYRWVLTNDADARRGLDSGDYAAVVTVPPTFSARATSAATATDPLTARQGMITVTTSRDAALADPVMSKDVADATVVALNQQVVQTYLDQVYVGFTTIHGKIGEAADGASRLASGTTRLSTGSRQLADGTSALVVGLGELSTGAGQARAGAQQLADGAHRLRTGSADLASGAGRLADGTGRLVTGSGQLSAGLDQLQSGTAQLPQQTRQLADGARQVADGNRRLADTVVPYADKAIRVIDTIPALTPPAKRLRQLAVDCRAIIQKAAQEASVQASAPPVPGGTGSGGTTAGTTVTGTPTVTLPPSAVDFCRQLQAAAGDVVKGAVTFDGSKAEIRGQVVTLRTGVIALKNGSAQVADGADRLAAAAPQLTSGIATAAAGGRQLRAGLVAADGGAEQVASGARRVAAGTATLAVGADGLSAGVGQLASGSGEAADGARTLTTGADRLASGAVQVDRGAGQLASGLGSSRNAVPSYTAEQRRHLAEVAAAPALAGSGSTGTDRLAAGYFLVLALWVGGLATFLTLRPVPAGILTSRSATWRLVLRSAGPAAGVAVVSGLLLGAGTAVRLDLGPGRGSALTLLAIGVALCFTVLHQALVAASGRAGWAVSLAMLVLTASVGVLSTVPSALTQVARWLPTHDAVVALRAAAVGGDGMTGALFGLVVWLLLGVVLTVYVTERRRMISPRLLRRPVLA
jgi:putative membrane protein